MKTIALFLGLCAALLLALAFSSPRTTNRRQAEGELKKPALALSEEQVRTYLAQTSDGRSLTQALTAARFGLQWREPAPGDSETGGGYLGMSHGT
jgi:Flp pilus assembly protein TadB